MSDYSNLRRNPFTGAYSYRTMDPESHTIAELSELPGIYGFQLQDKPKTGSVTVTGAETGGSEYNQVTVDPSTGQCRIDYTSGYIIFNVADNGKEVTVDYEGGGSNASIENITALAGNLSRIEALEEDVSATGGLLDRTTALENDVSATGGLLDRMDAVEIAIDNMHPVGSFYIQFPDADSNTTETAFPSSKSPATLFGGTWEAQWETEGIFFKTQGDPLTQTNGELNNRTDGLQTDMMQGHFHNVLASGAKIVVLSGSGERTFTLSGGSLTTSSFSTVNAAVQDGTNGTPRIGKETRGRNRMIIVWKRTA